MLKSAILAAKKKNNATSQVIFLTGNELDEMALPKKPGAAASKGANISGQKDNLKAPIEKTPSVKDTLHKIKSIGKEHVTEAGSDEKGSPESKIRENSGNVRLTSEELQIQFDTYIEKLKGELPRLYSALKMISPQLSDNQAILLNFQNNALLDDYKLKVRPSLLSFLRDAFGDNSIEIIETVPELDTIEKPKLYSDKEKLEHMIEKNPALQKLKSTFNLDFD